MRSEVRTAERPGPLDRWTGTVLAVDTMCRCARDYDGSKRFMEVYDVYGLWLPGSQLWMVYGLYDGKCMKIGKIA